MNKAWKKYTLEFLSIFIAVIAAFGLNNWNENRRDRLAEEKILNEIKNGLEKDWEDLTLNMFGHEKGIEACKYWRKVIMDEPFGHDSILFHYANLTRDFISIQNSAGYESLKSKGLEIVEDDSLRVKIISFYEYDFSVLEKLEEDYSEMQFHENYYSAFNEVVAPYFSFDAKGNINEISTPLRLDIREKNKLLTYLWKIQANRDFILRCYTDIEKRINEIATRIEKYKDQ